MDVRGRPIEGPYNPLANFCSAPSPSARQRRFMARIASQLRADPGTAGLCFLQSQ
ncbi:MAG TPA: hypothetical protein VEY49_00255 [Solirubrobacteraceae bacterium]|nr:hypothetical protein [Solirubrobacteraceae bacterium]